MSNQEMTKSTETNANANANANAANTATENTITLRPLVNIVEAENGFTLTAEMPGVPKENVEVSVENNTLTLAGGINFQVPDDMKASHAEVKTSRYQRAFTLSRELNPAKIEATQTNGVLTLHIPKAEHAKPRKIAVQTG